ncbi:MAG TPA: energy transducer TonB, partial [Thermoanaerobaculia bacterium]|nr:energy transducer TonB [Thermoanaerobaculia bacterium]
MKRTKLLALLAPVLFLLAAAEGPPYRVGGEVTPPVKISGADPVYTELARRARLTGVVIVEALIDERGSVTSSRVLKGLPMGLDKAA